MRRATLFGLICLTWVSFHAVLVTSASNPIDPYKVLGVRPEATQDEIKLQYRRKCLQYHPDKNVGKKPKERSRCEARFKEIQSANSLIGNEEARREYDMGTSFFSSAGRTNDGSSSFPRHQFSDPSVDEFYRAFAAAAAANASPRNSPFGSRRRQSPFFGFSSRDIFANSNLAKEAAFWNGGSLKSTFVQKIKVPMKDLYKGRSGMEFHVKDSIWRSYTAAFRGGFGMLILYRSLIFAAPLLRISRLATLAFSAFIFHINVPRPKQFQYTADIMPGYKDGTKIIFRDAEPGFDMVFMLEEEKHNRFTRVGNELHTTVSILASEAKNGCSIEIESLDPMEPPTIVKLRRNQIKQSGDTITVKGKGWPNRKDKHDRRGDLIVTFKIVCKLPRQKAKAKEAA